MARAQDTMNKGAGDLGRQGHWSPTTGPNLGEENAAPKFGAVNNERNSDTSNQATDQNSDDSADANPSADPQAQNQQPQQQQSQQPGQQAQEQKNQQSPDQVQQVIQAQADAKKKAIAEQTRTSSEQDKKDALVHAGKMGDAGVKAGLVVVGAEAAVAGAVVAGPAAVQAVPQAGRVIGAAAETYVPGGVATLNQIPDAIRGWRAAGSTTPGTIPQTPGGLVGAGARTVYEIIKAI